MGLFLCSCGNKQIGKEELILEYSRSVEDCGFSANPGTIMKGIISFGPEVRKFRDDSASEFGTEYAGTLQVLRIISCGN